MTGSTFNTRPEQYESVDTSGIGAVSGTAAGGLLGLLLGPLGMILGGVFGFIMGQYFEQKAEIYRAGSGSFHQKTTVKETTDDETADAETADAETADGETADDETADDETADDETADDETADAEPADWSSLDPGRGEGESFTDEIQFSEWLQESPPNISSSERISPKCLLGMDFYIPIVATQEDSLEYHIVYSNLQDFINLQTRNPLASEISRQQLRKQFQPPMQSSDFQTNLRSFQHPNFYVEEEDEDS
ncbi:hypothetical protein ACKVMT_13885 [Halobacteriales archaeon Cl-PHB]